jgi:hypothetical protein
VDAVVALMMALDRLTNQPQAPQLLEEAGWKTPTRLGRENE